MTDNLNSAGLHSKGAGMARKNLDPERPGSPALEFEARMNKLVIGQPRAVRRLSEIYGIYKSGLQASAQPLGTLLLIGPTGSGKTHLVEAAAKVLFSDPTAYTSIRCSEFQLAHDTARLIGSPSGYIGHRKTEPLLSPNNLYRFSKQIALLLFDEIEQASDALWDLLLGILDKGTLTLGDNRRVDFSQCIICCTSSIGAPEMEKFTETPIGFAPMINSATIAAEEVDKKTRQAAKEAAKRFFSPEFINRFNSIVVFRKLLPEHLEKIFDLLIQEVQQRIVENPCRQFELRVSPEAKHYLLTEGTDNRYSASALRRIVERKLVEPLASMVDSGQILSGDLVVVDESRTGALDFSRIAGAGTFNDDHAVQIEDTRLEASDPYENTEEDTETRERSHINQSIIAAMSAAIRSGTFND